MLLTIERSATTGLDPTKKLVITKQPMMDCMVRLDSLKGKLENVDKIGEFLKDSVVDENEAKQLGLVCRLGF